MDIKQLESYRLKLFRDANSGNKPDRTPNQSFHVTWKMIDAGVKFTEALSDYNVMERVVREHYEKYQPDQIAEYGTRNPYRISLALNASNYVVSDEDQAIGYFERPMATHEDLALLAEDPQKFICTKGMAAKYPLWNEKYTVDDFQHLYNEYRGFIGYVMKIGKIMKEEYGLPSYVAPKPYCYLGVEYLFNHIRGIKGFSVDLRRDEGLFRAAIDALQKIYFYPSYEAIKKMPDGKDMNYCFDYSMDMLAYTVMSNKQFEKYYWPYMQQVVDLIEEKNMTMRLFTQGSAERLFDDYLSRYKKGTLAIHSEHDDLLEVRKRLPNCANIGGMTLFYLGSKTKHECLDRAKMLIDTLGADGGYIMSQDKQGSYKNDCNAENYQAVCDFVREYQPSQN